MAKREKKEVKQETTAQRLSGLIKSCRQIMRKDKGMNGDADRLPMLTWIMFLKFLDDVELEQETKSLLKRQVYKPTIESPYRWRDWAKNYSLTGDDFLNFISNERCILSDGSEGSGLFFHLRSLQSEAGNSRKDVIATVFKGINNRMINGYLLRDVVNKIDSIHFNSTEEVFTLSHLYESILKEMRDASGDAGEFYTPRPVVKFMVEMLNPQIGESVLDPAAGTGGFLVEAFDHLQKQAQNTEHYETLQTQSIVGGEAKPLPYLLCQMNLLLHGLEYPNINSGNSLIKPLKDIGDSERVDIILTNPPFGGEEERGILNNFPEDKRTSETTLLFLQLIMRKLKRAKTNRKGGRAAVVIPDGILSGDGVCGRIKKELLEDFDLHTVIRLPEGIFHPYTDIPCNLIFFQHGKPTQKIWFYELQTPEDRKKYTKTKPLAVSEFEPLKKWWNNRVESELSWVIDIEDVKLNNYNLDYKNPSKKLEDFSLSILDKSIEVRKLQSLVFEQNQKYFDDNIWQTLSSIKAEEFDEVCLNDVLTENTNYEVLVPDTAYNLLGCSLGGRGLFLRETKLGQEISAKGLNKVSAGNFIYSRLFAWKGAFGVVPKEFEGYYVSNEFPTYIVDEEVVLADFLSLYFTRPFVWAEVEKKCQGTTKASRNRFKEAYLLAMRIRVPKIEVQKEILKSLNDVQEMTQNLTRLMSSINSMPINVLANIYRGEL